MDIRYVFGGRNTVSADEECDQENTIYDLHNWFRQVIRKLFLKHVFKNP